jgi:hypothetical protein
MSQETTKERRIVVMSHGWVMIGDYSRNGDMVTLEDASIIRKWGTERGLGQLALTGPTKETILDICGFVELPLTSVVTTIKVRQ